MGDVSIRTASQWWNNLWNESMPEQIPNKTVLYPSIKPENEWFFPLICFFFLFRLLFSDNVECVLSRRLPICDLIKVVQNTNMHKECYSITFHLKTRDSRFESEGNDDRNFDFVLSEVKWKERTEWHEWFESLKKFIALVSRWFLKSWLPQLTLNEVKKKNEQFMDVQ